MSEQNPEDVDTGLERAPHADDDPIDVIPAEEVGDFASPDDFPSGDDIDSRTVRDA